MVSIVVPSYGHEQFLRACVESVLAQTFQDWELLILDDRSPDRSKALADQFANRDARIKSLSNPQNLGTYSTENRGIDLAQGDRIAILNSDDVWHPEKLARQVEVLGRHRDAVACYCLGELILADGRIDPDSDQHLDYPRGEKQDLLPHLLDANRTLASGLVFRKGAIRFEDGYSACGDWVAMVRLSLIAEILFINEPLVGWRQHGANTFQGLKHIREQIGVRRVIERECGVWQGSRPDEPWNRKRDLNVLALAADMVAIGEMAEARQAMQRDSVTKDPFVLATWKRRRMLLRLPYALARWRICPAHHWRDYLASAAKPEPTFGPAERPGISPS